MRKKTYKKLVNEFFGEKLIGYYYNEKKKKYYYIFVKGANTIPFVYFISEDLKDYYLINLLTPTFFIKGNNVKFSSEMCEFINKFMSYPYEKYHCYTSKRTIWDECCRQWNKINYHYQINREIYNKMPDYTKLNNSNYKEYDNMIYHNYYINEVHSMSESFTYVSSINFSKEVLEENNSSSNFYIYIGDSEADNEVPHFHLINDDCTINIGFRMDGKGYYNHGKEIRMSDKMCDELYTHFYNRFSNLYDIIKHSGWFIESKFKKYKKYSVPDYSKLNEME